MPFRYEARRERPIPAGHFAGRLLAHALVACVVAALSLAMGMEGYVRFEHLSWTDAFLNAAMLLGGMGPVNPPQTEVGKLFAGMYALYAGLVFLVIAGLLMAPMLHRILHRFHWDEDA